MEEEKILQIARKSLSLYPRTFPSKTKYTNYDVFRNQVSKSFLRLFRMSEAQSNKHTWENGVNLAPQMQAIFQVRAKPQSPNHTKDLEKYEGRSRKLARIIDVRHSKSIPSRKVT